MKVQIPLLNKATGRLGDLIFQSYYGNTYSRSMPILFHYPDTPKQQATQATFFDIQRIWSPIYMQLSMSIKRQQRKNKNPFNVMSSFIYKIFHPYNPDDREKYPENFGLDRLNRLRPNVAEVTLKIDDIAVDLNFDMNRPWNGTSFTIEKTNLLLFNITRQSMYFTDLPFVADTQSVSFSNTNHWEQGDTIVAYMSLSCESWLGNFNKIGLWSR